MPGFWHDAWLATSQVTLLEHFALKCLLKNALYSLGPVASQGTRAGSKFQSLWARKLDGSFQHTAASQPAFEFACGTKILANATYLRSNLPTAKLTILSIKPFLFVYD